MKWSDVKPGDKVFHNRTPKTVSHITESNNVWDYGDTKAYVEVSFIARNAWDGAFEGLYCILASKTVRPVQ
jgi:hypothetical protein